MLELNTLFHFVGISFSLMHYKDIFFAAILFGKLIFSLLNFSICALHGGSLKLDETSDIATYHGTYIWR